MPIESVPVSPEPPSELPGAGGAERLGSRMTVRGPAAWGAGGWSSLDVSGGGASVSDWVPAGGCGEVATAP